MSRKGKKGAVGLTASLALGNLTIIVLYGLFTLTQPQPNWLCGLLNLNPIGYGTAMEIFFASVLTQFILLLGIGLYLWRGGIWLYLYPYRKRERQDVLKEYTWGPSSSSAFTNYR